MTDGDTGAVSSGDDNVRTHGGIDIDDPRVDPRHLRAVDGSDDVASVLLVGVVHDHPASVARVRRVVEDVDPDRIALEVPRITVPLYRYYAATDAERDPRGGEITAAIQAGSDAEGTGIDAPGRWFARILGRHLRSESASLSTVRSVVENALSLTTRALYCRLAATTMAYTDRELEVDRGFAYDCDVTASPEAQAAHERRTETRSRSLLRAVEVPTATEVFDAAREEHMARRLDRLRESASGPVVAVIGAEHLDAVATSLVE